LANRLNRILTTSETGLVMLQKTVVIVAALGLALVMVTQIILRYWLMRPFLGIEESTVLLGLWLYFIGAAYTTRQGRHIKGGIAALVLKNQKVLGAVEFGGSVLCLVGCIVFGYYALSYFTHMLSIQRVSTYLHWPTVIWVSSMLAGFVLMTLYFLIEAVRRWQGLKQQVKGGG